MITRPYLSAGFALVLAASLANTVIASEEHHNQATATASNIAASAEAIAAYPLTTCVVSGDPLEDGDMGPPINYVYREDGKADRLVRFCCKSCIKDFKKDPAGYLKIIDDAAAKSGNHSESSEKGHDGHKGHAD